MSRSAREEDASIGDIRYQATHEGYDVDVTGFALLATRAPIARPCVTRVALSDLPDGKGPYAIAFFGAVLNDPVDTTLPRLLNAIGDDGTPKSILGVPFQTARLLSCLRYVHARPDDQVVVDVVSVPRQLATEPASMIHVRSRDWRVGLMSLSVRSAVTGEVRL